MKLIKNIGKTISKGIQSLSKDTVKYGGYAAIVTVAFALILLLFNIAITSLDFKFDLTEKKLFSLSDETIKFIKNLKDDIRITAIYKEGEEPERIKEVLNLYAKNSPHISLRFVDLDKNPGILSEYKDSDKKIENGSIIIESQKAKKILSSYDLYEITYSQQGPQITGFAAEKIITTTIYTVAGGKSPIVYELEGHQETPLSRYKATELLERENITLKTLNFIKNPAIPADAKAIIIYGIRRDISPGEAELLQQYLDTGGHLIVVKGITSENTPNLDKVLSSYGIRFDYGIVGEPNRQKNMGNPFQVIPIIADHDISKKITENKDTMILQWSMAIKEESIKRKTIKITPLLTTTATSFMTKNFDKSKNTAQISKDETGPFNLAVAIEEKQDNGKTTRIVAIAADSLMENLYPFNAQIPANIDFFIGSILWSTDRKDSISVGSKSLMALPLSIDGRMQIIYTVLFVIIIPLAFIITALVVWLRRKNL
ncbi:GldG family protein [Spirochaetia bacterium 38H-sp]|uniref:GldG family protein n=1 Tax=Rarispira pelagica TaxID=3141764 RepID=A0ABU9UBX9_9SPIR